MKKWLSFLLALCMLLSLTACGNESGGPSGNPSEPKSPTDVEVELSPSPSPSGMASCRKTCSRP